MVNLIRGDCLEEMDKLIANGFKANLTFTSPPYNMNLRIQRGRYCSRQIVKELSTKYENFADNKPIEEYYEFNKNFIEKALQISDTVFCDVQFLTGNKRALYRLIGYFYLQLKEIIIWDKVNAQPAIGQQVLNSQFEVILVFEREESKSISRKFTNGTFNRGTLSNLWNIKRGKKLSKTNKATFPLELADKVITNFTNEGDIVFDPFMGIGTAGISALNNKRSFVGIELDENYFETAKKLIGEVEKENL